VKDFENLKAQLDLLEWPSVYLFKFIVPNDNEKIALTSALFDENADISYHTSTKGTYVSVSVKEVMISANAVIEIYEKAVKIEGIISL
jgi:putative lipoic acid-binding regulatory protein